MSRPPFPNSTEYLQIYPSGKRVGNDELNIRDTYYPASSCTESDIFTMPGSSTVIHGAWVRDDGDKVLPNSQREPRDFCLKGKASLTFSGTAVIVRIEANSGWGKASVYIDGVQPSTISGIVSYKNTIDCNASNLSLLGVQYVDVLVADGLSSGSHTISLYANNTGANEWFVFSAIKVRTYSQASIVKNGWKAALSTHLNDNTFVLENAGVKKIRNVSLQVPSQILMQDGSSYPSTISIGDMNATSSYSMNYAIEGTGVADSESYNFVLTGDYIDPSGSVPISSTESHGVQDSFFTFPSTGWTIEPRAADGVYRAFSSTSAKTASFTTTATSITFTLERDYGWGNATVKVGSTVYGALTCSDAVGGQFLTQSVISGLPAGSKKVVITKASNTKVFSFTGVEFNTTIQHSNVTETIPVNFNFQNVPPFPVPNARIENGAVTWDAINRTESDYTIPRDNTGFKEQRVYSRFPTFAVYYQSGKEDILNKYDVLIIEPSAVSREQVAKLQAQGIIVLGYVSFGEENSDYTDIYDFTSGNAPHIDDGLGVGGYASYYCKLGNNCGEASECKFDNQRLSGSKTCALSNIKYAVSANTRCSKACTKDWIDGYAVQSTGGACGGGYTSANNWHRDAMKACSNTTCSGYNGVNSGCSQYQISEVHWAQDFSAGSPNYPDQNGIWGSSFINPIAPRWKQKLRTFYLPTVLDEQVSVTESITLISHSFADTSVKPVFRVSQYPIDDEAGLTVSSNGITWRANIDYTYNAPIGTFVFEPTAGADLGLTAPVAGDTITVSYVRKGLQCDGLFMDTIDSVDVYPSPEYQSAFTSMINELKVSYPNKRFCSNRGFSILNNIIKSCSYVMFESFISEYNWDSGQYFEITDTDSIAFNNGIKDQLRLLRKSNVFDVLALNYCDNADSTLRQKIYDQCYKEGYLCWTSTILLNNPMPNTPVTINGNYAIRSNALKLMRKENK